MSYPVCLDLQGRRVIVAGAGRVAGRKVEGLLAAGAKVTVLAPSSCDEIQALAQDGRIRLARRRYRRSDLRGAFLAVAATDDETANAKISADAREQGILVNVADRPDLCTFTLPAVARRGDLVFAISTGGRCPSLARILRQEVEHAYGPEYGVLLNWMGKFREKAMALGWESERVSQSLTDLYGAGLLGFLSRNRLGLKMLLAARLGPEFACLAEMEAHFPCPKTRKQRAGRRSSPRLLKVPGQAMR